MLDLEQIADSGELFDGHYKLLDPLNTYGATADIWLAIDTQSSKRYSMGISYTVCPWPGN